LRGLTGTSMRASHGPHRGVPYTNDLCFSMWFSNVFNCIPTSFFDFTCHVNRRSVGMLTFLAASPHGSRRPSIDNPCQAHRSRRRSPTIHERLPARQPNVDSPRAEQHRQVTSGRIVGSGWPDSDACCLSRYASTDDRTGRRARDLRGGRDDRRSHVPFATSLPGRGGGDSMYRTRLVNSRCASS
jgi:hypothetical protein